MSTFEEIECYMSLIQALYEHDMSTDSHSECDLCTIWMRYERDELDVSANITQYGWNVSAFYTYRDERDMNDMSAIRMR